jgi:hypothetical protein
MGQHQGRLVLVDKYDGSFRQILSTSVPHRSGKLLYRNLPLWRERPQNRPAIANVAITDQVLRRLDVAPVISAQGGSECCLARASCSAAGTIFGNYGIWTLIAAYRLGELAKWGRLAVQGAISMLISAALANFATRLMSQSRGANSVAHP